MERCRQCPHARALGVLTSPAVAGHPRGSPTTCLCRTAAVTVPVAISRIGQLHLIGNDAHETYAGGAERSLSSISQAWSNV
jgi:hypothetical protein